MITLKVTRIGNSAGVILPKELLTMLNVSSGDSLYVTASPDGIWITPHDPKFVRQMSVIGQVMKKRRNMLRAHA